MTFTQRRRGGGIGFNFTQCVEAVRQQVTGQRGCANAVFNTVFADLRKQYGEETEYVKELSCDVSRWHTSSAGKSGSFLGFSPHRRYILKSLPRREVSQLKKNLNAYREHMRQPSLLTRLFGLFCIHGNVGNTYVVIMANALFGGDCEIMYDLKGSWLNRVSGPSEAVQKDQNWCKTAKERDELRVIAKNNSPRGVSSTDRHHYAERFMRFMKELVLKKDRVQQHRAILDIVQRDVLFLRDTFHAIDYSLLVGMDPSLSRKSSNWHKLGMSVVISVPSTSSDKPLSGTLYLSIIDFLSTFDSRKKVQWAVNNLLLPFDRQRLPRRRPSRKRSSVASSRRPSRKRSSVASSRRPSVKRSI